MKIILASQSPGRKKLFENITQDFEVITSNFDESSIKKTTPKKYVKILAKHKCEAVFDKTNGDRCKGRHWL